MIEAKLVSNKIGGRGSCYPSFLRGDSSTEALNGRVREPGDVIINRATGDVRIVTDVDTSGGTFTTISSGTARTGTSTDLPTNFNIDRHGGVTFS